MTKCIRCELNDIEGVEGICVDCRKELKQKFGDIAEEVIDLYRKHTVYIRMWREDGNSNEREVEE